MDGDDDDDDDWDDDDDEDSGVRKIFRGVRKMIQRILDDEDDDDYETDDEDQTDDEDEDDDEDDDDYETDDDEDDEDQTDDDEDDDDYEPVIVDTNIYSGEYFDLWLCLWFVDLFILKFHEFHENSMEWKIPWNLGYSMIGEGKDELVSSRVDKTGAVVDWLVKEYISRSMKTCLLYTSDAADEV